MGSVIRLVLGLTLCIGAAPAVRAAESGEGAWWSRWFHVSTFTGGAGARRGGVRTQMRELVLSDVSWFGAEVGGLGHTVTASYASSGKPPPVAWEYGVDVGVWPFSFVGLSGRWWQLLSASPTSRATGTGSGGETLASDYAGRTRHTALLVGPSIKVGPSSALHWRSSLMVGFGYVKTAINGTRTYKNPAGVETARVLDGSMDTISLPVEFELEAAYPLNLEGRAHGFVSLGARWSPVAYFTWRQPQDLDGDGVFEIPQGERVRDAAGHDISIGYSGVKVLIGLRIGPR